MKKTILSLMVFGMLLTPLASVAIPANVLAEPHPSCKNNARFLTFPRWYDGLVEDDDPSCNLKSPEALGGVGDYIWRIALNIIQIILQIVVYAAVGFIIYGGFVYLTSAGRSDKINRGREMILNAVIGLTISLFAIALVAYIGGQIGAG